MSAGLSASAKADLYAAECGEQWLPLISISHSDFAATLRYVADTQNVTSRSNTYTALALFARLPADRDAPVSAELVLDNVDRATISSIRSITDEATVTIETVRRSAPDTVLRSWPYLRLRQAEISASQIACGLSGDEVWDEEYPGTHYTPSLFPAGFKR